LKERGYLDNKSHCWCNWCFGEQIENYKGLTWDSHESKYHVQVSDEGKLNHVCHCSDVVQAARLYDEAAKQYFGKKATVNFPSEDGEIKAQEEDQGDLHRLLPAVQRLIRRDWVAVLAAAASLKELLVIMVTTAVSSEVTWTTRLIAMATAAGELLSSLPGFGEYGQAKIMRIVIYWYLHLRELTFSPGDVWFNWDTMSDGMPEKLADMKAGGIDTASPRRLVASILQGGWLQSQKFKTTLTALTSGLQDSDMGCLVCDFMVFYAALKKRQDGIDSDLAIHAFLHYLLTSREDAPRFLRENGVNAGILAFFLHPPKKKSDAYPPAPLLSSKVVVKMKANGNLVKYFAGLSRDHGGLLLNHTWLDPWVTTKVLCLLFEAKIKSIVANALTLAAAAAARTLLRQAQEEAEVQDVSFSFPSFPKKKKTKKEKKEEKEVRRKQRKAKREQKRAQQAQKMVRQKDKQQRALRKRDRREKKARQKAEGVDTSNWPGGWIYHSSAASQVGKYHEDMVDGVHDTSDIVVEDEDGAECNANEEEKEVSELCKALDTKLDDWARDVHTMLTHLHPVPRGWVLTALVAELQKSTNDLPSAATIDKALPRVIGLMHKHIKYVRTKLSLKQVKKLSNLGGFNNGRPVLHRRSNPTTLGLHSSTELSLTEHSLMRTPQSDGFWQTTFVGWDNYMRERHTKEAEHKQTPRQVWTPSQKRRREEEVLAQKEPPKKLADAKQKEKTGKQMASGYKDGQRDSDILDKIEAASPRLNTLGGLILACYIIDNVVDFYYGKPTADGLTARWVRWRSEASSVTLVHLLDRLAPFLAISVVQPELLQYRPVTLFNFLSEQGWHFMPYSIVFAANCRSEMQVPELPGGLQIARGKGAEERLIATVLSDGSHFAIYLGLTTRVISTAAFMHAKGAAAAAVREEIKEGDLGVITWHASARLGWGRGPAPHVWEDLAL
jgi:hypothetical protein